MQRCNRSLYCPIIAEMMNNTVGAEWALNMGVVGLTGLISSFGILENLLILWVVGFRVRRSVNSIWILNLAASDLLATASLPFFTFFLARGFTWTLGTTFCKLHSSVFFLNMFVSGFLLAVISLDCCLMAQRPVWCQNHRHVGLATRVCWAVWGLALLNTMPYYLFRDNIPRCDRRVMCYYNFRQYTPAGAGVETLCRSRQDALAVSKFLLSFLLPLLVIVGSYMGVSISITRRVRRRTFRFLRLVVAVIVTFVLSWAPYHIFSVLEAGADYNPALRQLVAWALPMAASLAFLNSMLNPLLYVFSCPDFLAKIRQSLGVVLENVLMEDLGELVRRRSSYVSANDLQPNGSILRPAPSPNSTRQDKEEDEEHCFF